MQVAALVHPRLRELYARLTELGVVSAPRSHAVGGAQVPLTVFSLATVYRTMRVLEESGAIQRHAFGGGPARFEGAEGGHHDHLIDIDTGEVVEFSSARIEALQEEIAARLGYEIVHHRLELYGRKIKAPD